MPAKGISVRARTETDKRTMLIRCGPFLRATEFEPPAGSPNSKFNKHIPNRARRSRVAAQMFELVEDSPYNGGTPSTGR